MPAFEPDHTPMNRVRPGYFLTPGSPFGSGESAWPKPRPPRLKAAVEGANLRQDLIRKNSEILATA